jgi:hypothetical protein
MRTHEYYLLIMHSLNALSDVRIWCKPGILKTVGRDTPGVGDFSEKGGGVAEF